MLDQLAEADIVLTTFETVSSSSETLRHISWFRVVLDEGIVDFLKVTWKIYGADTKSNK